MPRHLHNPEIISKQRIKNSATCKSNAAQGRKNWEIIKKISPRAIKLNRRTFIGSSSTDAKSGVVFQIPSGDYIKVKAALGI